MIELRVSDVRHWTFCKRVLWHRRVAPHRTKETPKMALGHETEAALAALERRRTSRRYGVERAERRFDVRVESDVYCVSGICDLVLDIPETAEAPRRMFPVDVKRTTGGVSPHHLAQLAGYAVCLEETFGLPLGSVDLGFIVVMPEERIVDADLGSAARRGFTDALAGIRAMLEDERFPEPTKHRSFCTECEYLNFCGDVL